MQRKQEQVGGPHDPAHRPILLVRVLAGREEVVHRCQQAAAAGVQPGMTLAHARALIRSERVHIEPSDPVRDQVALRALAGWATRFTPTVAPDWGDDSEAFYAPGLLADVTGCQHLYRGETNLLRQWLTAVGRLGFQARIASAPTFGCAWMVARFGRDDLTVVCATGVVQAITGLPTRGLRIDGHTDAALAEVGIQTIGQLMALPRYRLPSRFGDRLIQRLDQALGCTVEVLEPVRPAPPLCVTQIFAGPVKRLEMIERTARQLLEALCQRLRQDDRGVRHTRATLVRSDCPPVIVEVTTSRLGCCAKHLWSLLRPKLERAHLGFGVETVTLTALSVDRLPHPQAGFLALDRDHHNENLDRSFGQVVDTLTSRLGVSSVRQVEVVESHVPEYAYRLKDLATDTVSAAQVVKADRPTVLLDGPQSVEVMAVTPDGPLVRLSWHGQTLRVLNSIGPERIAPMWWRCEGSTNTTRDYFKVQDETGRWWWIYRDIETHRWFIHGRWA